MDASDITRYICIGTSIMTLMHMGILGPLWHVPDSWTRMGGWCACMLTCLLWPYVLYINIDNF